MSEPSLRVGQHRRALSVALSALLALVAAGLAPTPAHALSPGVAFSAESLSSWQLDGYARAVAPVAGRVVVGGRFDRLVPPASSSGTPVAASGLAVLDADTGEPTACRPQLSLTGGTPTVWALAAAPSGGIVYVGGDFSTIGGVAVQNLAAIDVVSCTVTALRVPVSTSVYGLTVTADTLYLAGRFGAVNGQTRHRFAAVSTTTGALRPFAPDADLSGRSMAVSPDGKQVAIGGDFTTVNGAASHSIAVVDAASGATIKAYGAAFVNAASVTKAIVSDGTSFYVGNEGTGSGVFDGRIALDWSSLNERWRDRCLGATQALAVYQGILYSASHAHDCSSIGAFPNGSRKYFMAEGTADRRLRGWFPLGSDGVNEGIGPRGLAVSIGASGNTYLYAVGEFTTINGKTQQGITRFGTTDTGAPTALNIQAEALTSKAVQVRVSTVVDSDDETLTYRIYRDGASTPIWTGQATSFWWTRPQITFTDTSVTPGKTYSYRVTASDGTNTSGLSGQASATAATKALDYPAQVIADGARLYWRFDEASGGYTWNRGVDSTAAPLGQLRRGAALGAPGAIGTDTAATFDGVDDYAWTDQLRPAPTVYSIETWIKTSTTRGGRIVGYTDSRPQTDTGFVPYPSIDDRHVYMDDSGRLTFGTTDGTVSVVRSAQAYNDGRWHHVVASQDAAGMVLYVDGARVGGNTRSGATVYLGVWKVGGDRLLNWPDRPTSDYFAGSIDDTAVYEGTTLSADAVLNHYRLSGNETSTTVTLDATADTMVAENAPTTLYGTSSQISTRAPGAASELQSYLRFDLSGLPVGATITGATLELTTSTDSTAASIGASDVRLLTGSWSEASTRWTNRPTGLGSTVGRLTSAPRLDTGYDVALDAAQIEQDSTGEVNLALVGSTSDNVRFNSRQTTLADAGPHLVLTYRR